MDTVKSYVFLVLTQGTCVLVHWTLNVVSDIESLHLILYIKIGLIGTYKSGWFLKISCTLLHISLLESYDTWARIHFDPLGSTQTCGAMSKLSHQTLSQCLRFLVWLWFADDGSAWCKKYVDMLRRLGWSKDGSERGMNKRFHIILTRRSQNEAWKILHSN